MTDLRTAAQQALEALEGGADSWQLVGPAIDALKKALVEDAMQKFTDVSQEIEAALAEPTTEYSSAVEPVQEPVAVVRSVVSRGEDGVNIKWLRGFPQIGDRLYTAPLQRKPLTEEELDALAIDEDGLPNSHIEFARAIERAHGIGRSME